MKLTQVVPTIADRVPWYQRPDNPIVQSAAKGDPWAKSMVLAAELDDKDRE